jgi:hypothetical protein
MVDNALVNLVVVLVEVRRKSYDKLVEQSTNTVDICSLIVALTRQYLRAHVLWGPAEAMAPLAFLYNFGQAKVCNLEVAIDVNQDVFWLDVPINNFQVVHELQTFDQLAEVELGLILGELLYFSKMEEHLATRADVHHEKELTLRLEGPVQLDDERVVELLHYETLVYDWFYFLFSNQFVLAHDFHGVQSPCIFLSHQYYSTEGPPANDLYLLEVVSTYFEVCFWILGEVELGKVRPEEFVVVKHTNWPVVLS